MDLFLSRYDKFSIKTKGLLITNLILKLLGLVSLKCTL